MRKMNELLKRYQLISFFLITYIFTWLCITPLAITNDEQKYGVLALLGLFGPALINIFISKKISLETLNGNKAKRIITFIIIWITSTVVFCLNVTQNSKIESPYAIAIFSLVSLLPAFVISSVYSKIKSVNQSLSSIVRPQGKLKYYLFALAIPPIIKLVSLPLNNYLGLGFLLEPEPPVGFLPLLIFILISFGWGFLFTGGLNEEVGWSGFALPRLQARFNPIVSSIILWFFWILWHIPLQVSGLWNADFNSFIQAVIGTFFARFVFTWLFNKTKGGILSAILFHVSANVAFAILPTSSISMTIEAILAVFIIIRFRMFEKLSKNDPAVYNS